MLWWLVVCTKKIIQDEDVQIGKYLLSTHRHLCEHGNFAPRVANREQPRYTTPEVEEGIMDVVKETPGTVTRRVSMQLGVTHSTLWRCCENNSCILTSCSV
jgi:hypothetical protein